MSTHFTNLNLDSPRRCLRPLLSEHWLSTLTCIDPHDCLPFDLSPPGDLPLPLPRSTFRHEEVVSEQNPQRKTMAWIRDANSFFPELPMKAGPSKLTSTDRGSSPEAYLEVIIPTRPEYFLATLTPSCYYLIRFFRRYSLETSKQIGAEGGVGA